jgi:putative PEP-CTERM system histidine kinase
MAAILISAVCALSLLAGQERTLSALALISAISATAALELFDLMAVRNPDDLLFWKKYSLTAEGFIPLLWLLYTAMYARREGFRGIPTWQKIVLAASLLLPLAAITHSAGQFFYSPDFTTEHLLFLENISGLYYLAFLILLVIALINLESVLVHSPREARWRIKFELIGVGALLATLIFYYSQGLLYRSINMEYVPLRSMALITAAVMIAYSVLWRGRSGSRVHVSMQMSFRSAVLMVVGCYLVGLGLLGEGMRYLGDPFRNALLMGLGFTAGTALLIVLFSETAKRKLRIFLHRNFYRQKYDYRIQWLQFTDRLASAKSADDLLYSIVLGFCETFGMGCGALYLSETDTTEYRIAALLGTTHPHAGLSREDLFVRSMDERHRVVNIPEEMPGWGDGEKEFLIADLMVFAVPLSHKSRLEGFILLGRPLDGNESYHDEDYDLMHTLAHQASSAVLNLRLSEELSRAREMEAMGKVSAFVLHDLKNLVSTLALVLDNAGDHMDNPEFQKDMLHSLDRTVIRMKGLMAKLRKIGEKTSLRCESADLLELAHAVAGQVGADGVSVSGEHVVCAVDTEEMQKVLLNLLLNAVEASDGMGKISLEAGSSVQPYIRVRDSGCGMPEEFVRTRLFKPFNTTKTRGLGIGLYQCRQIAEAHGGRIEVSSEVGKGSTFTVWLPERSV